MYYSTKEMKKINKKKACLLGCELVNNQAWRAYFICAYIVLKFNNKYSLCFCM
jgi:hypothetical protein